MSKPLTREDLRQVLEKLMNNSTSRKKAASWALKYLQDDSCYSDDDVIEDVIVKLSAVDLISTDRPYLYTEVDFKAWLEELEEK